MGRILYLVPTERERRALLERPGGAPYGPHLRVVGFGAVGAAVGAARLLAEEARARLVLLGIAGTFDVDAHPLGTALAFGRVRLEGVGAGQGAAHHPAAALGFPHLPELPPGDLLELEDAGPELLTVTAASGDAETAAARARRHQEARAEEMEGFGVALAARAFGAPCHVLRGLSNRVGDRDLAGWAIPEAMDALLRLLQTRFGEPK